MKNKIKLITGGIIFYLVVIFVSIYFLLIPAIVFIREYLMHHANEIHKTPQIHIIPLAISYSLPFYKKYFIRNKKQWPTLVTVFRHYLFYNQYFENNFFN